MKLFEHIEMPYEEEERDYKTACLWCGNESGLSVSKSEGHVFQCWKCKESGNALSYMREWYSQLPDLTMLQAKAFVKRKPGVPGPVLKAEGIKFDGGYYWFPVYNTKGDIIALHKYNPQNNITYASPKPWNCSILGLHHKCNSDTVYVAEGHHDYLVLRSLITKHDQKCLGYGTAGSGFSGSYLHVLENKNIVLLFDNDEAGAAGVQSVAKRMKASGHVIGSLKYLDWSKVSLPNHDEVPNKFDLRDWVVEMKGAL